MALSASSSSKDLLPMEMVGLSMAPFLRPGDKLLIDRGVATGALVVGDIVAVRAPEGRLLAHRIIGVGRSGEFRIKGDRNVEEDPFGPGWQVVGRVVRVYRNHAWRILRGSRFLAFMSRWDLFPGGRLPICLGRSYWRDLARSFF